MGWLLLLAAAAVQAQLSLSTAVDLAMRNSPRVKMALADVDRATAALAEARAVYVPTLTVGGSGYGRSYGYPQGQPSVLNIQTQSLVFNYQQRDYVRAMRSGILAANSTLVDARDAVAEDTVVTYFALFHDQERLVALGQQRALAERLVAIVEDRLGAGQDSAVNLTTARLSSAQLQLARLRTEDDLAGDRLHFQNLTGLPAGSIAASGSLPELPAPGSPHEASAPVQSPAIAAAFANARSRYQIAFGDARYLYRPQISFGGEYSRISTFNNSNYLEYFGRRDAAGNLLPFPSNSFGIGLQVSIPFLDKAHREKARESLAEAAHAQHEAEQARDQFAEGRVRLERSATELAARVEVAKLEQQLAQQQLEILLVQLKSGTGNPDAPQMTPKDEQQARIAEREKYLALLDSQFEMQRAEVNLLRQTGELDAWLKRAVPQPAAGGGGAANGAGPAHGAGAAVSGKPIP